MARGGFTEQELEALNKNKYVLYAENNKIAYSNEFKHLFMRELLSGKRPYSGKFHRYCAAYAGGYRSAALWRP